MADLLEQISSALADRYRIERQLGAGGMATVYLAEDLKHRRKVALKVLQPELASVLERDRLLHEIEMSARLTHPHILPLQDFGDADGFLFLATPWVDGETLGQRLAREGQLSVSDAVQIGLQISDALGYLHEQGIVHRDIKPQNILLVGSQALLCDLGLPKAVGLASREHLGEASGGFVVGTPEYMSPETIQGLPVDARSDVYSLGCTLYEMLAGTPPFAGPTEAAAVPTRHVAEQPVPISILRPELRHPRAGCLGRLWKWRPAPVGPHEALVPLVQQALEKIPSQRQQDGAQVFLALAALLRGLDEPSGGAEEGGNDLCGRLNQSLGHKYRVLGELGRGGMAIVCRADDLWYDRRVALKTLLPDRVKTIDIARFLREIRTTARLSHPNIVPLFEAGTVGRLPYYVMPLVDGGSLRNRLQRGSTLAVREAVQITATVADALQYAHDCGFVHRDIKPENILMHQGQAVVADFGIAKSLEEAGVERLTATGVGIGTYPYVAPEQMAGERELDGRTDVYSLGCVLYEMITGRAPRHGSPREGLAAELSTASQPRSSGLDEALLDSLSFERERRHPSAAVFRDRILAA